MTVFHCLTKRLPVSCVSACKNWTPIGGQYWAPIDTLGGPERASCADVHKIASAHLASVRSKLSDLVKLESILAETVAQCSDGATPDCPVLNILDAGRQSELDHISDV